MAMNDQTPCDPERAARVDSESGLPAGFAPGERREIFIRDFLERHFVAARLGNRAATRVQTFERATTWLQRAMGRPPVVTDLTPTNIEAVEARIAKAGFQASAIKAVKSALSQLAKHAWRIGLLPHWRPISDSHELRIRRPAARPVALPGTLAHAVREILRPLWRNTGKPLRQVNEYEAAVTAFDSFLGRASTPADLCEHLEAFRIYWQRYGKHTAAFVSHGLTRLRCIARALDPQMFPDARQRLPPLPTPPDGSIRQFFEATYRPQKLMGRARKTIEDYQRLLRALHHFGGRDLTFADLTDSRAADFFEWLSPREPGTINKYRRLLLALTNEAVRRGLASQKLRVGKMPVCADAPDAWTEAEVLRLIEAAAKVKWLKPVRGIPQALYWRALLLVAYWTGLRRRSLLELKWSNLDLATGWLNVPGQAVKNRVGKKLRLGPDAIAALLEIRRPNRELIFPSGSAGWFYRRLDRIFAAAGLSAKSGKTRGPHRLHKMRRTAATIVARERGLSAASEFLGHSNLDVTRRYIDVSKMPGVDATQFLAVVSHGRTFDEPTLRGAAHFPPAKWVDEAQRLFQIGFTTAAVVTGRIAIERCLLDLQLHFATAKAAGGGISDVIESLRRGGILDQATIVGLKKQVRFAHRAAHGVAIEAVRAAEFLLIIARFIARAEDLLREPARAAGTPEMAIPRRLACLERRPQA
ncbi:MAG TPA: tyrosine-type recombinase/integrase [Pirellulales bacterium]|jgi:integrase|nr:tyrosine-type recombinase/integrase [Pirellulales bacterium]